MGLTLHLGNRLGMTTEEYKGDGGSSKGTMTDNEFRVSLFADYGIGAVTFGIGLFLGVESKALDYEEKISGGTTTTVKANSDVTTFGIPIMFKVQF